MKNHITVCDEYEWLLIETQQKPLPEALEPYRNNIFFITPADGDLAKVKNKEYVFKDGVWIEYVAEKDA